MDVAFTPAAEFRPGGPSWETVFGEAGELEPTAPVDRDELVGQAWHHVLHARACIARGKPWQAEWLISGLRDQTLALACLRLGLPARFAKGADQLPPEIVRALEPGLVRSLEDAELRRALAAATTALAAELERSDPELVERLRPLLGARLGRSTG